MLGPGERLQDWPSIESAVRRIAASDPATDGGSFAALYREELLDALDVLRREASLSDPFSSPDAPRRPIDRRGRAAT